jgi:hypothetical protein
MNLRLDYNRELAKLFSRCTGIIRACGYISLRYRDMMIPE